MCIKYKYTDLHVTLFFVASGLDVSESSRAGLVHERQSSGPCSIAAPGRPLDCTRGALWWSAGFGDVELTRCDGRTHGPRHFHLVCHDRRSKIGRRLSLTDARDQFTQSVYTQQKHAPYTARLNTRKPSGHSLGKTRYSLYSSCYSTDFKVI